MNSDAIFSHLHALEAGLFHEKQRLAAAKTAKEREIRRVWIAQIEKEIMDERRFLKLDDEMTDDEILNELLS